MRSSRSVRSLAAVLAGVVILAAGRVTPVDAKEKSGPLKLKTERVIVFKDGYCLIIKRGTAVTDSKGEIYTEEVPDAAVLGSFWAVPKEGRLVSMLAGWEETTKEISEDSTCTHNLEVLQANKGKACKVELSDKTTYSGTIREVLAQKTTTNVPPALRSRLELPATLSSAVVSGITGSNFVLSTKEGDVLLPVSQVRTLTIRGMKTTLSRTVTTKKRSKRLTFRFEKPRQKREMLVMYFRPGLRWIPTYRIELDGEEKKKMANITLQAEIINEAEDIEEVPVDIVVGVPNFRFRKTPSPLVLERTLRNALQQAAPQLTTQLPNFQFSNAIMTQRAGSVQPQANPRRGGSIQLPAELTATGTQDLFIYSLPKLSFKQGERMAVQIFTAKVPYRDVYTWDLHFKRRDIEASPSAAGLSSPLILSKNQVWHQIELTNSTNVPWTTGAAMIMQGNQPLAQELLAYTSPKSGVRVPVTVSVDTRGNFSEKEIGRQLKAITWDRYNYAKIDKEAKLWLRNSKAIPIEAEITFRFGGKYDEISDKGHGTLNAFNSADWQNYRGSSAVNNSTTVLWKTTIQPGKTFEPTVKYHYYTRH